MSFSCIHISTTGGAARNATSPGKVAGAVVGTLLGVTLLGTAATVVLMVLLRRGHLGALLSKIIPCGKTSGSLYHCALDSFQFHVYIDNVIL